MCRCLRHCPPIPTARSTKTRHSDPFPAAFLPSFKPEIDQKVKQALDGFGVHVVLGERVNLTKLKADIELQKERGSGKVVVESLSNEGNRWEADLVLTCTGQIPNTSLMAQFCPLAVHGGMRNQEGSSGLIRVNRGLQISPSRLGPSPVETPTGAQAACECGFASSRSPGQHSPREAEGGESGLEARLRYRRLHRRLRRHQGRPCRLESGRGRRP
ncbi:hypothetical protein PGTUg99_013435 [Puccinia graminis f. sp. tritici]|uniref:FAD/NAD(P)-binding domain-containing protein n=1 Tax=Puccinia graminis f. sp. tritici TaxID=56615 RepID=A0A5B0MQZ8_PUCGR|nr:hypothetical protein PGTUg99_013435 [Puccinia graminis f. sp. tritici]